VGASFGSAMYHLRGINNLYRGGNRTDFLIVGHPEFTRGKVPSGFGLGPGWDMGEDRNRRGGCGAKLPRHEAVVDRLGTVPQSKAPGLKERAIARSRSAGDLAARRVPARNLDNLGYEDLLRVLADPGSLPLCGPNSAGRATGGATNHLNSQGTCKHYASIREDLLDVANRLKSEPEATAEELLLTGAWKYYAQQISQASRRQKHVRAQSSSRPDRLPAIG